MISQIVYRRIHLDCFGHQTQNVRTAVQLLSRSVANAFEESKRPELAYAIRTINNWFDCMDSRVQFHKYNRIKSGLGVHWKEQEKSLKEMLILMESMVVCPVKKPHQEKKPFQKGIIVSIKAVLALWAELKEEGCQFLLTHRLNQDCLENFFSCVRAMGRADTNPNPVQFCSRIRILKLSKNIEAINLLVKDKKLQVSVSDDQDEDKESFISSEIGM